MKIELYGRSAKRCENIRVVLTKKLTTQCGDKTVPQAIPHELTVSIEHPDLFEATSSDYQEHIGELGDIAIQLFACLEKGTPYGEVRIQHRCKSS